VRKADNLPPSCAVVTKSGNLNFLEPSGPLRACNGTALPLIVIEEGGCAARHSMKYLQLLFLKLMITFNVTEKAILELYLVEF